MMRMDDITVKSEDNVRGYVPENMSRKRKRPKKNKVGLTDSQKYMEQKYLEVLKELEKVKREFRELQTYVSRSVGIRRMLARPNKPKLLVDLNAYFQEAYVPKAFDEKSKGILGEVPQDDKKLGSLLSLDMKNN